MHICILIHNTKSLVYSTVYFFLRLPQQIEVISADVALCIALINIQIMALDFYLRVLVVLSLQCLKNIHAILSLPTDSLPVSRDHGGRVVTLSPCASEAGVWFIALPQVGKLVVACHRSTVYSTEP